MLFLSSRRVLSLLALALLVAPAAAVEVSKLSPPALPLEGPAIAAPVDPSISAQALALPETALEAPAAAAGPSAAGSGISAAAAGVQAQAADAAGGDEARRDAALDAAFDHSRPAAAQPQEDAEALFAAAHPASASLETFKRSWGERSTFSQFANGMIVDDLFSHTPGRRQTGDAIVPWGLPERDRHVALIDEILSFADRADADPLARRFVALLAQEAARENYARAAKPGFIEELPPNPLSGGEYWDFASGPNGARLMMGPRDSATTYRFFDRSAYVVEYLTEMKRLMLADGKPAANVEIAQADVRRMARPPTPISVIRSKNVHTYVDGFVPELERMTDWVAPGGDLVLQNDPGGQRQATIRQLGPMIERLLAKGWRLRFGGFAQAPGELETLTLSRPRRGGAKPDAASRKVWKEYVDQVHSMRGGMDMGALLQLLMGGR